MSKDATANDKLFIAGSYRPSDISGEAVTIPSGAAGSVVSFYIAKHPITDSHKSYVGGFLDTTLVLTSTAFTTEVPNNTPDASLANGEYWVNYITGECRGKKADNSTSLTAAYSIFIPA